MKFTIKKNWHYSSPFFIAPWFRIKELYLYDIKFDKNCWYEREEVEYTGINKISGLGFGLNHQKNSIRIGWQPDFTDECKKKIKIHAYWYDESQDGYQEEQIGTVDTSQKFDVKIKINRNSYIVTAFGIDTEIKKTHNKKWGLWLKPYFGGKSKAPETLKIWIKSKTF